jgi:radical SAM family uncharacterized protein
MSQKLHEKVDTLLAAERGAIYKARGAEVEIALAYPNTYHIGMSNLGMHQIYYLLNKRDDTSCERVFLPDEEDIEEYEASDSKLFSLESRRPIRNFDIVAFSVSFEQDYLNILEILRLSGIPLNREERMNAEYPFVVLGGICSFFNPEPLADFFDIVIVGEGEDVTNEFIDLFKANRSLGRRELLRSLSRIPGVYIPEFYEVFINEDGTIKERRSKEPGVPDRIVKRTVREFDAAAAATVILTPYTEFDNRYLAEITRGCGRHCRFCMAGYIYLPPRNLGIDAAMNQARRAEDLSGRIGLVGAAISDYPLIGELCAEIKGGLSVSSLRADSVSETLIDRLAKSGHKTVAVAPEAGSERLRKVINKGIAEVDILRAADLIFSHGIPNMKLYFIIGLPTETMEDIEAIIMLANKTHDVQLKHARPLGRIGRITLSVNSFVPKPFTPFQWEPMESVESLNKKIRFLDKAIKKIGNTNMIHDLPKWEHIQAFLSRGDRRLGKLIRVAHEQGGDWKKASKETGINADVYAARRRGFEEILPWDFIDIGVRKEYLRNEYERALEGKFTAPCRVGMCKTCGVCK